MRASSQSLAGLLLKAGGRPAAEHGLTDLDLMLHLAYKLKYNVITGSPMLLTLEELGGLLRSEGVEPGDGSAKGAVLAFLGFRLRAMEGLGYEDSYRAEVARLDGAFAAELTLLPEAEVRSIFSQAEVPSVPSEEQPQLQHPGEALVACSWCNWRSQSRTPSPWRTQSRSRSPHKADRHSKVGLVTSGRHLHQLLERAGGPSTQMRGAEKIDLLLQLADQVKLHLEQGQRMRLSHEELHSFLLREGMRPEEGQDEKSAKSAVQLLLDLRLREMARMKGSSEAERERMEHMDRGFAVEMLQAMPEERVRGAFDLPASPPAPQTEDAAKSELDTTPGPLDSRSELDTTPGPLDSRSALDTTPGPVDSRSELDTTPGPRDSRSALDTTPGPVDSRERSRSQRRRGSHKGLATSGRKFEEPRNTFDDTMVGSPGCSSAAAKEQDSRSRPVGLSTRPRDLVSMLERSGARAGMKQGAEKNDLLFQLADQVRYNVENEKRMLLGRGELCRFLKREDMQPEDGTAKSAIKGLLRLRLREMERLCYEGRAEAQRLDEDFAARLAQIPEETVRDIFEDMLSAAGA